MNTIEKSALLEQLDRTVESHLQESIAKFQNLPEAVLLAPSKTGGWSIAQCLDHLNSYGRFYHPAIEKGMQKNEPSENGSTFSSTWLGHYFIKIMDPQTGKKKFKAFKNHVPAANLDAYKVVAEFIEQQEHMLRLLAKAKKYDLNKVRIPLSIFKFVTFKLGDAFQFIIAHNERHIQQAKRNLS